MRWLWLLHYAAGGESPLYGHGKNPTAACRAADQYISESTTA
jgi:hypothetical protein